MTLWYCLFSCSILFAKSSLPPLMEKLPYRLGLLNHFSTGIKVDNEAKKYQVASHHYAHYSGPVISIGISTVKYYTGLPITPIIISNSGGAIPGIMANEVITFAGDGTEGAVDHTNGLLASFGLPSGLTGNLAGDIYVSDLQNNKIRKVSNSGTVSTYAGSGEIGSSDNLLASLASFYVPAGIAADIAGNLYVAERLGNKIRKISPAGVVTTLAGSGSIGSADNENGLLATFNGPEGIAVDGSGTVYVADRFNRKIRKISPTGAVSTIAGTGDIGSVDNVVGTLASFGNPFGVAVDLSGNIFVVDRTSHNVRKISPTGSVTTFAGDGTAGSIDNNIGLLARFRNPSAISIDKFDNLYIGDLSNNRIRKITPGGAVSTLAGSGAVGSANAWDSLASFSSPRGVWPDLFGNLYIADAGNKKIRKVNQLGYTISPALPAGLNFDPSTGTISGTPLGILPATNYTITATNTEGTSSTSISISIVNAPTINIVGSLTSFASCSGQPSAVSEPILVSGGNLEGHVTIIAPAGFEISMNSSTGFTSTIQLTPENGVLIGTSVFVRLAVTELSTPVDSIQIFSSNAITKKIPVSGIINPLPTLSGNFDLCQGSSSLLTGSTLPALLNPWMSGNIQVVATNGVGLVTSVSAGSTSITYNDINGCSTTSVITVRPQPEAPLPFAGESVCSGDPLQLTASSIPNVTYSWNGPKGFTSGLQNPVILHPDTTASGIYTVKAILNGCSSTGANVVASVKPVPEVPNISGGDSICEGESLLLGAGTISGASYLWSGPGNFTSVIQNPVISHVTTNATGIYSVTATVNGCKSAIVSVTATVKPIPSAPIAITGGPVCAGNELTLTASLIPGASYKWTGPENFTSNEQNPVIGHATIAAAGVYSVKATLDGCYSVNSSLLAIVKQVPNSPNLTTAGSICVGSSLLLFADSVPNATYNWVGPNNFISISRNPIIHGATLAASGVYSLSVIVDGCASPNGSVLAVVNPIPSAPVTSSTGAICAGENLSLYAGPVSDATFHWTGPGNFDAIIPNPVIPLATTAASGLYSVAVTVNGCTSIPASVSVLVKSIPSAPIASRDGDGCIGGMVTLHASSVGNAKYTWSGPNGFYAEIQNPVIENMHSSAAGIYRVTATIDGCKSPNAEVIIGVKSKPLAPVVSPTRTICSGTNLSLNVNVIPGTSYTWRGPDNFTSQVPDPVINNTTIAASGMYAVIATVDGCESDSSHAMVTVNPTPNTPVLSSDGDVCAGATAKLYAFSKENVIYSWSGPDNFQSSLQNPILPSVTITASGVYRVTTSSLEGCISQPGQISLTVMDLTKATISTGGSANFCNGDSILLQTGPGRKYFWSNGDTTKTITIYKSGNYSVRIEGENGCKSLASESIKVNVFPPATLADLTVSRNGGLCEGDTVSLGSSINSTLLQWNQDNIAIAGANNQVYTAKTSGIYTLQYIDSNGCKASSKTIELKFNSLPFVDNISGIKNICVGDSIPIRSNTLGGTWISAQSEIASVSPTGFVFGKREGRGFIEYSVINANGCVKKVSDSIRIYALPIIAPIIGANRICSGDSSLLKCNTPGGIWNAGNNSVIATLNSSGLIKGKTAGMGTISYSVANDQGCVSTRLWDITVNDLPFVPEILGNKSVCMGEFIKLSNSIPDGVWGTISDFHLLVDSIGNVKGINPGTGIIQYTIKDTSGCVGTARKLVVVDELPKVTAISSAVSIYKGGTVQLQAKVTGPSVTYAWKPANTLNDSTTVNPVARILRNSIYSVTATSFQGCIGSDSVHIEAMDDLDIQHTTLLTPNGDGVNDFLILKNLDMYPNNRLQVFDRNGKIIFIKNNYNNDWNGTIEGKRLTRDTYFYILSVKEQVVRKGTISVYH